MSTVKANEDEFMIVPDYLLKVHGNYTWVLDAKAPDEKIRARRDTSHIFLDIHLKKG